MRNEYLLYILSGISVFLFALDQIKFNLNQLFSSKISNIISKSVNTKFKSFLFGFIAAATIQSSSGTTAIAISLLSSKYIKKESCLGIIIGANLGTCVSTFLTAINTNNISFIILIISSTLYIFIYKYKKYIILLIYIGFMLLGLDILNKGFDDLIYNRYIYDLIQDIQNSNTLSLLFGIFSTAIIQSSSGIISIVEGMYECHLINLESSIAIMLGANIGTTLTGYLATLYTTGNTKQIVNINLIFNIIGVVLFIIIFNPFIIHIRSIENNYFISNIKLSIAYSHFIFNIITVLLAYIFFKCFVYFLNKEKNLLTRK